MGLTREELFESVTVSRMYLHSQSQKIKELEDKVAALEAVNRELTAALNEQDIESESF